MEYRLLIWNIKNEKIALDNSKKMLIFSSVPLPMPLRAVPVPMFMPMHACVQQRIVETKDNKWGSVDTHCNDY